MDLLRSLLDRVRDWVKSMDLPPPILTIELVPSPAWGSNVRAVLTTVSWDILRKKVYRAANYHCEICGGQGKAHPVECHEVWDYNDKTHVQKLVKMTALCPACHAVKHFGLAMVKDQTEPALHHLATVNGWTGTQALKYVNECFEIHRKRSAHHWTLDLSALEKYGVRMAVPKS